MHLITLSETNTRVRTGTRDRPVVVYLTTHISTVHVRMITVWITDVLP